MRLVAGLLAAFLALAASAAAADILIRPGVSIGKLRLGMLEADVRKAYAYPYAERETRPFGRERVELSFGLSGYTAVLYGPVGRARVVRISTLSAAEKTAENVRVGWTEARVRAVYGGRMTCDGPFREEYYKDIVVYASVRPCYLRARDVETVFGMQMIVQRRGIAQFVRKWEPKKARVYIVTVQTVPQPRFE